MMNNEFLEYDVIAKLRWLQVTELAKKYGNDQELGAKVRELTNK